MSRGYRRVTDYILSGGVLSLRSEIIPPSAQRMQFGVAWGIVCSAVLLCAVRHVVSINHNTPVHLCITHTHLSTTNLSRTNLSKLSY